MFERRLQFTTPHARCALCFAGQHCRECADGMLKADSAERKGRVQTCSQPSLDKRECNLNGGFFSPADFAHETLLPNSYCKIHTNSLIPGIPHKPALSHQLYGKRKSFHLPRCKGRRACEKTFDVQDAVLLCTACSSTYAGIVAYDRTGANCACCWLCQ